MIVTPRLMSFVTCSASSSGLFEIIVTAFLGFIPSIMKSMTFVATYNAIIVSNTLSKGITVDQKVQRVNQRTVAHKKHLHLNICLRYVLKLSYQQSLHQL